MTSSSASRAIILLQCKLVRIRQPIITLPADHVTVSHVTVGAIRWMACFLPVAVRLDAFNFRRII